MNKHPHSTQLCMIRQDLCGLLEINLPKGYSLRPFCPGDELAWETLIAESFERQEDPHRFDILMKQDPSYEPHRVLFVCFENQPVATASAWYREQYGPDFGYIHMVGVLPAHQGKGLGYWVNMGCLRHFAREGRKKAALHTDDFRLAAIKTYLKLGFKPKIVEDSHIQRWRKIFETLNFI